MKIKIFGKELFDFSKSDKLYTLGQSGIKESKFLTDFYQMRDSNPFDSYISLAEETTLSAIKEEEKITKKEFTPKEIYELKTLNDTKFRLNVDPQYIENQLENFKEKLSLIKSEEYDMARGVKEISSVIVRLENRKKYAMAKTFFEEFPYTTTSKISELVKEYTNLQLGQIAQFVADMPKEAVKVMKDYNAKTSELCGKQAVYYIIADKKDFNKSDKRRDPILLAQSPFGHFWQILGAWDKEMMFLEEL